jgi:NAD(P)H-quinone oxidoreductase subunit 5
MDFLQTLVVFVVAAPGLAFVLLSLAWLAGLSPSERLVSRLTALTFSASAVALAPVCWKLLVRGGAPIAVAFGNWFAVGEYRFPLVLLLDRLSLPFVALTVALAGLIGEFSVTYLHRERGFLRFFVLLHLFTFGSLLAFSAASFDLVVAGWEVVGITSVLLIAFFQQRPAPVENALRVFAVYRACDIGLLIAVFAMHHWSGTATFVGGLPSFTPAQSAALALLLLLAAAGKAAQVPFSGWLPRAMEGPTPSSAIFYGAISIHAGAYLLLRAQPLIGQSKLAAALVITTGLATAIHGTLSGRASADAKTSLAYASLTQVGVVFVEIGLGWTTFAVIHIVGHAITRTLQFLRAPSMLHDYHKAHSAAGGDLAPARQRLVSLLPEPARLWLYRWALDRGHLDTILDRCVVGPLMRLSAILARLDGAAPSRVSKAGEDRRDALQRAAGQGRA